MDIVRGFIGPKSNVTIPIPGIHEWFKIIPTDYLIFLFIGSLFTLIVIVLGFIHLIYVLGYISNEQIQTDLYWMVISICGSLGMILPRSALFLYAIALVYFMLCLFVMVTLMTTLHGSRSAMCEKLQANNIKISVRVMPLGCCLFCFPKLEASEYNFRRIEWLVFQSPLVRIFLEILNIVVFLELNDRNNELLTEYRFSTMFRMVDLSQLAYSVQKFIFDFLAAIGVFENGPHLPDTAKAQYFTSFLLTFEMLIVSIIATIIFRPASTSFFDKHNVRLPPNQEALQEKTFSVKQNIPRHLRSAPDNLDKTGTNFEQSSAFFMGFSNPGLSNSELSSYSKTRLVRSKSRDLDVYKKPTMNNLLSLSLASVNKIDFCNEFDSIEGFILKKIKFAGNSSDEFHANYDSHHLSTDSFYINTQSNDNVHVSNILVSQKASNEN